MAECWQPPDILIWQPRSHMLAVRGFAASFIDAPPLGFPLPHIVRCEICHHAWPRGLRLGFGTPSQQAVYLPSFPEAFVNMALKLL